MVFSERKQVKERLDNMKSLHPLSEDEEAMRQSITDRLIKPAYQKLLNFIGNATPKEIREKYENTITSAGSPRNITFASILAMQIMFSLFLALFLYMVSFQGGNVNSGLVLSAAVLGFLIPYRLIKVQADKRRNQITRSLPDLLDLLYVSVEAGLSFDLALKKTVEKIPGPLSIELNRTLDDISRGRNRQDALRALVKRTGVEDLSSFVTSVIQTEQLGSDITNMLRIQSTTMRQKRRQRAEEAARKVPVKMLIPLVFFIFPTLFIVVLGPAVIRIMETLSDAF